MSARVQLPKDARVAVAVPSNGTWSDQFGWHLAGMLLHTQQTCPPLPVEFLGNSSSNISHNRQRLVEDADARGSTHLLFLDSDMAIPRDTLLRLLAHDLDVVGAVYAKRGWPPAITAQGIDEKPLTITERETGLRRVRAMGLGCVMIRMDVFRRVSLPAFQMAWDRERGCVEGEDWHFFRQLEGLGVEVWADMDLSWQVGHIGAATFQLQQITGMANG